MKNNCTTSLLQQRTVQNELIVQVYVDTSTQGAYGSADLHKVSPVDQVRGLFRSRHLRGQLSFSFP